jgi:MFS family permease
MHTPPHPSPHAAPQPALGLRANLGQFSLLVLVNAFVGAMVGLERTILPAMAEEVFHLAAKTAVLSFIVVFGVSKAITNYLAGHASDRIGRKHVLVAGWLVAAPVPFLLMWATDWTGVLVANALLGISQGLTWSTTVIMKIDLAGPRQRGLATGLNEFSGYLALAGSAFATGLVATHWGLRPAPFWLGAGYVACGLLLSLFAVRETQHHVAAESRLHASGRADAALTPGAVFRRTTWGDRNLASISQAGLVNNLNDGMAWGLFPLFFAAQHLDLARIGLLAALYPAVWGVAQIGTGAWSDRLGRKWMIAAGMWVQAAGLVLIVTTGQFAGFAAGSVLLGLGTAMVYPTLIAAIGDVAHPSWRASAVGVYRFWRDLGYAVGALLAGIVADALGLPAAFWVVAALTFASGLLVAAVMRETHVRHTAEATAPCIEPAALSALAGAVLVDVRSAEEFAAGHVDGAVHAPLETLTVGAAAWPRETVIVTICGKGGGRSEQAAAALRARGFAHARSLCGGTLGWQAWRLRGA